MAQGFLIDPGTSAEQLAAKRRIAEQLLQSGMDASPVGHPLQAMARALQGGMGGYDLYKAGEEDKQGATEAQKLLGQAFGGGASADGAAGSAGGALMALPTATRPAPGTPAAGAADAAGRPDDSADLYAPIRQFEGFAPTAKWDYKQNSGGYGSRAAPGQTFTRDQAETAMRSEADPIIAKVRRLNPSATQPQVAALTSAAYNLGPGLIDKLAPDIQAGNWDAIAAKLPQYNHAGGEVLPALTRRRQQEAAMLLGGGGEQLGAARPAQAAQPAGGASDDGNARMQVALRLMGNRRTAPIGQMMLQAEMAKEKAKPQVVGPGGYLVGADGRAVFHAPESDKERSKQHIVAPGSYVIDADGRQVFHAPPRQERPQVVAPGGHLVDDTGKPIYQAPEKRKEPPKPQAVAPGGYLVDANGRTVFRAPQQDYAAKAEAEAIGTGRGEARQALPGVLSSASETFDVINQLKNHPGLSEATGMSGLLDPRNYARGTDAYNFAILREQAQGTALLAAVTQFRGTGALSDAEGKAGTAAVARMSAAQSKPAFIKALRDYNRVVRNGVINSYEKAGMQPPDEVMEKFREQEEQEREEEKLENPASSGSGSYKVLKVH